MIRWWRRRRRVTGWAYFADHPMPPEFAAFMQRYITDVLDKKYMEYRVGIAPFEATRAADH